MQTKIKGYLETYLGFSSGTSDPDKVKIRDSWDKIAHAIAQGVVEEIQANAVVSVSTPGAQAGTSVLPGTGTVG
jgi:hypothetical protein